MPDPFLLAADIWTYIMWGGLVIGGLFVIALLVFITKFAGLWVQSFSTGAGIRMTDLIWMHFRKVNPTTIVRAKIASVQAGIATNTKDLEAHYLAGGDVIRVVRALIAADRASIKLDFKMATGIDLAGRDVLEAVQTSVNPKVIDSPDPTKGRKTIDAVAKDGIQLRARGRVTVRANIERLVGGATEETIIARVGEGIVSSIGSAETHAKVLENPDLISKQVLAKGLDAGTAFEILSIDIADVDVGENIGAKLQADQAEADKRVAQAKAEERRAMAVAREQEMVALVAENRAKVVLAEAEVPKAMAQAFREGNMGIMDYLNIRNVQSDTRMRDSLGGDTGKGEE